MKFHICTPAVPANKFWSRAESDTTKIMLAFFLASLLVTFATFGIACDNSPSSEGHDSPCQDYDPQMTKKKCLSRCGCIWEKYIYKLRQQKGTKYSSVEHRCRQDTNAMCSGCTYNDANGWGALRTDANGHKFFGWCLRASTIRTDCTNCCSRALMSVEHQALLATIKVQHKTI